MSGSKEKLNLMDTTNLPPDNNNPESEKSDKEKILEEESREPKESLAIQLKRGFMRSTGKYKNVRNYNKLRAEAQLANDLDKVKELDLAFMETLKQEIMGVIAWPPKHSLFKTFWTTGHYSLGGIVFLQQTWIPPSDFLPNAQEAPPLPPPPEERKGSKGADALAPVQKTLIEEETTVTTTKVTKAKAKPAPKKGKGKAVPEAVAVEPEAVVPSESERRQSAKERRVSVKEPSVSVKERRMSERERRPSESERRQSMKDRHETGRRSFKADTLPATLGTATPTPSTGVPETPLLVNNFSTHRLHIANIPPKVTVKDLEKLFKGGEIDLYPDPVGGQMLATVKYADEREAAAAFEKNKKAKLKNKPLVVSPKIRE